MNSNYVLATAWDVLRPDLSLETSAALVEAYLKDAERDKDDQQITYWMGVKHAIHAIEYRR